MPVVSRHEKDGDKEGRRRGKGTLKARIRMPGRDKYITNIVRQGIHLGCLHRAFLCFPYLWGSSCRVKFVKKTVQGLPLVLFPLIILLRFALPKLSLCEAL
jgi:hypothetical protein